MAEPAFTDQELMEQIANGNTHALGILYDRMGRLVFSVAIQLLGDRESAEEVTQDVFLQVWKNAASYNATQAKPTTWVTSLARYRAIDALRRRKVRPENRQVSWNEPGTPDIPDPQQPELQVALSLQRQQVESALAQLPEDQRQALALAFLNGFSHQQIAAVLNAPLGTVKTRIRLAMHKLRALLIHEQVNYL